MSCAKTLLFHCLLSFFLVCVFSTTYGNTMQGPAPFDGTPSDAYFEDPAPPVAENMASPGIPGLPSMNSFPIETGAVMFGAEPVDLFAVLPIPFAQADIFTEPLPQPNPFVSPTTVFERSAPSIATDPVLLPPVLFLADETSLPVIVPDFPLDENEASSGMAGGEGMIQLTSETPEEVMNIDPALVGDFNNDGVGNSLDIPLFKQALETGTLSITQDAGMNLIVRGDFNNDNLFDENDIPGYKQFLATGEIVPEPSTLLLMALSCAGLIRPRKRS